MTGEGGFNQVIFENAPMPGSALLGREGEGWKIAMTTLTFERGAAEGSGGGNATSSGESTSRVAALAKRVLRDGRPAAEDPVLRDRSSSSDPGDGLRANAQRCGFRPGVGPTQCCR
jgi:alkylation response protein AidB-like acyl-CoA dehydrogenase